MFPHAPQTRAVALATGLILICIVYFRIPTISMPVLIHYSHPECAPPDFYHDVFIMIKTGACEDIERLLMQSKTSLQCAPSTSKAYFSNLDENIGAIRLRDSLANAVEQKYMDEDDEFVQYKKLQEQGSCKDITEEDMAAINPAHHNGNAESRGWTLDKWKYLPIVEKSWTQRSDANWYILIEADTFILWPNLLHFLLLLDVKKDYYIGSPMFVGDVAFIYGGSGTVVSRPAMERVVDHIRENSTDLQSFTHHNWAGDHILGKALKDVGVRHSTMSREFVRDSITGADYSFHWCTAALSFHHVQGAEAVDFYTFETEWLKQNHGIILRHKDIFQQYIMPKLQGFRSDWDNNARDEMLDWNGVQISSFGDCRAACSRASNCVQYRFAEGKCYTSKMPQLGQSSSMQESGWLPERVAEWARQHSPCTTEQEAWSPHD